eukprot:3172375-Rhodomonas_salina.2
MPGADIGDATSRRDSVGSHPGHALPGATSCVPLRCSARPRADTAYDACRSLQTRACSTASAAAMTISLGRR